MRPEAAEPFSSIWEVNLINHNDLKDITNYNRDNRVGYRCSGTLSAYRLVAFENLLGTFYNNINYSNLL